MHTDVIKTVYFFLMPYKNKICVDIYFFYFLMRYAYVKPM